MDFFKRAQKPILLVTSAIVISSFALYGVFSVVQPSSSAPAKEKTLVLKTKKGRKVFDSEIEVFEKIFQAAMYSQTSALLDEEHTFASRWLQDRLAMVVLRPYINDLVPIVSEKIRYLQNDRGYVHPKAPYIAQYKTLSELSYEFGDIYQKLKGAEEITPEVVGDYLKLFVIGSEFSSDLIRTVLLYQQKQLPIAQQDPSLAYRNFAHFGWKKPSEWIGKEGLLLLAKSFEQLYDLAASSKHKLSLKETQKRFFQVSEKNTQELQNREMALYDHLAKEGIEQGDFWTFWQKWFVIDAWMNHLGKEVQLDLSNFSDTYAKYLSDVNADIYEMPNELNFRDLFQMLEFQVYLDTISLESSPNLEMPQEFYNPDELKKKVPELVQFATPVTFQKISKADLESKISLRDLWSWQTSDNGWSALLEQFAFLKQDGKDRLEMIKALPQELKKKVDEYSLERLSGEYLAEHPDNLSQIATFQNDNLYRDIEGKCYLQKTKFEQLSLHNFLEKGVVGSNIVISAGSQFYYFKITGPTKPIILSFADSSRRGITKKMLDAKLEKTYQTLTKSNPSILKGADGVILPLQDCRAKVAEVAFEPLYKSLKIAARDFAVGNENSIYAFRFCQYLESVKKDLNCHGCTSRKIKETPAIEDITDLAEQWYLIHTATKIPLSEISHGDELLLDKAAPQETLNEVVSWKDKLIVLKVNGIEENAKRKESKIVELQKSLERTYLSEIIQAKVEESKTKGDF